MPLKYGIGKRIANAATTETRWDGLWMEARKEKLETPIQLCSFNTLWGCDVARAFTSNTFAVVFSWGKTWDFFFFFSFNRVSGWIEQRRFMKPFLEKRDSYLEFLCICELLLVPLKHFSLSLCLAIRFRAKRKMFYEIGFFLKRIRILLINLG